MAASSVRLPSTGVTGGRAASSADKSPTGGQPSVLLEAGLGRTVRLCGDGLSGLIRQVCRDYRCRGLPWRLIDCVAHGERGFQYRRLIAESDRASRTAGLEVPDGSFRSGFLAWFVVLGSRRKTK